MYAKEHCQTYKGPSRESGEFWASPSAEKSVTLWGRNEYEIVKEQGDWLQIKVYDETPWVEKKCMTSTLVYHKNTLKKGAAICKTKEQFKEFVRNRNNKAHLFQMMIDDKCKLNNTNAEVPVEILDGIIPYNPYNKVKVIWNNEIFIGWTDAIMIN